MFTSYNSFMIQLMLFSLFNSLTDDDKYPSFDMSYVCSAVAIDKSFNRPSHDKINEVQIDKSSNFFFLLSFGI